MQVSQTSAQFIIGGVIFDDSMPSQLRKLLNDKKTQSVLQNKTWGLCKVLTQQDNKDFTSDSWNKVFPFIISASCQVLILRDNYYENILMGISKTQFHSLNTLNLDSNNISSIEQLQFMNMSNLYILCLYDNKISNLSALNKYGWNSIRYLDLQNNPIQRIEVSRLKMFRLRQKRVPRTIRIKLISQNESFAAKFMFNYITGYFNLQMNLPPAVRKSMERKCVKCEVEQQW